MPISSLKEVVEAVEDMGERLAAILVLAATDGLTRDQARSIRASFDGIMLDARGLQRELDTTQDDDLLVIRTGENAAIASLRLWDFHRTVRRQLTSLIGAARRAQETVLLFTEGQQRKVVWTRSGDTLQSIALKQLGSWAEWPRLLEANPTLTPGALSPGIPVVIPEPR